MTDGFEAQEVPPGQSLSALDAVARAIPGWIKSLLDLTGRNHLLFCKPAGKIDLSTAESGALLRLTAGEQVRLSDLFPVQTDLVRVAKVAARIRKDMRTFDEELGVRIGRLTSGFVGWNEPDASSTRTPNAPLFLRHVSMTQPQPGVDDYVIQAEPDVEVNEVFLHLLERDFRFRLSDEQVSSIAELASENFFPAKSAIDAFKAVASAVGGLTVSEGLVLGRFKYQKLPMVSDLQLNADLFAQSDLIAAVAGNTEAMGRIRREVGTVTRNDPNLIPPADEFLVLDADPSQNYAINAALAGRNIVIQGPPGTGKSQTISNLIAASIARGKTVLFVAEKRAAIDAVLHRLDTVGLGGLVLDLHDGAANKGRVAAEIREAIDDAGQVARPLVDDIHRSVTRTRERLIAHSQSLHAVREPWGISIFDAQAAGLGTPEDLRITHRLPSTVLSELGQDPARDVRERLADAASLGAFFPLERRSPWATATGLNENNATAAFETAKMAAQQTLPTAIAQYRDASVATGVNDPTSLAGWTDAIQLFDQVEEIAQEWHPEVWAADHETLIQGCAPRSVRKANGWDVSWGSRRSAKKATKALRLPDAGSRDLYPGLVHVTETLATWRDSVSASSDVPRTPDLPPLRAAHEAATTNIAELAALLKRKDLEALPIVHLASLATALAQDPSEVVRTQRVNGLFADLDAAYLTPVLAEVTSRAHTWTAEQAKERAVVIFDYAWTSSIIEQVSLTDPSIGGFDGSEHSLVAAEYQNSDRSHRDTTPHRILRAHAEQLAATRNSHPDQERLLDVELQRRRRVKPVRKLIGLAPDVITSAKACWAMSPLVVSQALPATARFDLVIFDEASQIKPADAIPALARARQAVVCGDSKQLPPSAFFEQSTDSDEDDTDPVSEADSGSEDEPPVNLGALTQDTESILDVFDAALGSTLASQYRLLWHYRSRDARLIAFSDAWFYDKSLLTFPGTAVESPLLHVPAGQVAGQPQNVANEVSTVIDLVLEHARTRPHETLGVIAMGIEHSKRIQAALEQRLRDEDDPDLRTYFRESAEEPFFVKNLERVQGDERDAIIITMGYIKSADGRMLYRFGPINEKGGERRLNVAFSRAKNRVTLVSSFTHDDLDPAKLNSDGAKALRAYLQYVASGGTDLGDRGASQRPLNPFEIHLKDRLLREGIPVIPQYGVAGYWLDFAASHPDSPGKLVLALEADGASYHSSETARARDRLRQEHLERLGWTFHRIWSTDYFRNPDAEVARTRTAYDNAVAASNRRTDKAAPAEPPAAPARVAAVTAPTARNGRLPVRPYETIGNYTDPQLLSVIKWVMSDDLVRTDDEILEETMSALGFQRRGSKIVARITQAIATFHRSNR